MACGNNVVRNIPEGLTFSSVSLLQDLKILTPRTSPDRGCKSHKKPVEIPQEDNWYKI
jgi:hypothetical protein